MIEIWKDIPGYEGRYTINKNGKILNVKRNSVMAFKVQKRTGYCTLSLTNSDGKRITHLVHRLVALAYKPNPKNKPQVNHKDGIKTNNCVYNLEWSTPSENINHALSMGLLVPRIGEMSGKSSITNNVAIKIFKSDLPNKSIAAKFNIDIGVVYQIKNGKNWSSVTGKYYKSKNKRRSKDFISKIYNAVGSNGEIARKYNLTPRYVWAIKSKTLWKNL